MIHTIHKCLVCRGVFAVPRVHLCNLVMPSGSSYYVELEAKLPYLEVIPEVITKVKLLNKLPGSGKMRDVIIIRRGLK